MFSSFLHKSMEDKMLSHSLSTYSKALDSNKFFPFDQELGHLKQSFVFKKGKTEQVLFDQNGKSVFFCSTGRSYGSSSETASDR